MIFNSLVNIFVNEAEISGDAEKSRKEKKTTGFPGLKQLKNPCNPVNPMFLEIPHIIFINF